MEIEYTQEDNDLHSTTEESEEGEFTENGTAMEDEKRAFSTFPPVDESKPTYIEDWPKLLQDLASTEADQKQALLLLRLYVLTNSIYRSIGNVLVS
jgi:hypothetical protein